VLAIDLTDPSVVSPGLGGFLTLFVMVLAFIVLIRSMVGHLRKVRFRAEREAAEQEAAGQEAAEQEAAGQEAAEQPKG
jgi:hypothetical protein